MLTQHIFCETVGYKFTSHTGIVVKPSWKDGVSTHFFDEKTDCTSYKTLIAAAMSYKLLSYQYNMSGSRIETVAIGFFHAYTTHLL